MGIGGGAQLGHVVGGTGMEGNKMEAHNVMQNPDKYTALGGTS